MNRIPSTTTTMLDENPNSQCLLESLETQVLSRLSGRIRGFRVQLLNGGLVLTGTTKTYHAKQVAQHLVMEMTDVPIRANDIAVD